MHCNVIFISLYCCVFYFPCSDDMEGGNDVENGGGSGKLILIWIVVTVCYCYSQPLFGRWLAFDIF
jgi:hypothetical protein